jgi:transcriptional pleiotropic regulator of transition state genes
MKPTGLIRKMNEKGRVVLPLEWLHTLHMEGSVPLVIDVDGDRIVLKPYRPPCIFCGHEDNTEPFRGKTLCHDCLHSLSIKAV